MNTASNNCRPFLARSPGQILRARIAGTSIVEAVIAAGLLVVGFGGLFQISVRSLRMLRIQSELAQASLASQQTIDHLRGQAWGTVANGANYSTYSYTVTDSTSGSTTETSTGLLNTLPASAAQLREPIQTVTVSAYGSTGTPPAPFTVTNNNGTVTVSPTGGTNLSDEKMIRVNTRLEWKEQLSGRIRAQEAAFIISPEGTGK